MPSSNNHRFLRVTDPSSRPQAVILFPVNNLNEYRRLVKCFVYELLLVLAMAFIVAVTTVVGFGRVLSTSFSSVLQWLFSSL
ncbi:hypothetical protein HDV64DRAFT_289936 [Trichoderma sp. TUCIM 5745]